MAIRLVFSALVLHWLAACAAPPRAGSRPEPSSGPRPGEVITNCIGMELAYVPAGEFTMGSPADEAGREEDERPHVVRITRPLCMGVTEVTQAQWAAVMGPHRCAFEGADRPVEQVSWTDARAFCAKLSDVDGHTYRLPTEAQWEYACRAGAGGRFGAAKALDEVGWYDDNSDGQTHPVGQKAPNAWGLYDVHGNVAEWCADYFDPRYPANGASDPAGPPDGKARVIRGGSWAAFERGCRCASRGSAGENYQLKTVGFRVVRVEP